MLPDRVSNPGPLTCESGVLPIALRGLANTETYYSEHSYYNAEFYQNHPMLFVCFHVIDKIQAVAFLTIDAIPLQFWKDRT